VIGRWASFATGLWLLLAPLVLGYASVAAVLHEVALGLLVCVATLAALEWPQARFALLGPAAWLLTAPQILSWAGGTVRENEIASGLVLLALTLVPSGKFAAARAPAKVVA
jgi:hypothetical protein